LTGPVRVGRNKLAAELASSLISVLQQFQRTGFESLVDEWLSADYLRGKVVKVAAGDKVTVGVASGISSDGQLLVDIDGALKQVVTGEVSIRAMP